MMRSTLGCLGRLSWRYFWGPRGLSTLGWLGEEYLGIPANCPTKWSMRRTLTLKEDWGRNINTHMWGSIHMQVRELHIDAVMLWPTFWPRPVTKDWLCQQFRCATMLIVPQHSYKVCLHVHKHCCVHPHICSRWVLCIETRCTPHTVQAPLSDPTLWLMMRRVSTIQGSIPAHPVTTQYLVNLTMSAFPPVNHLWFRTPPTCKYMAIENMTLWTKMWGNGVRWPWGWF